MKGNMHIHLLSLIAFIKNYTLYFEYKEHVTYIT